jgi:hypothetical protein
MDYSGHNWRFPGADYSEHRNPPRKKEDEKELKKRLDKD